MSTRKPDEFINHPYKLSVCRFRAVCKHIVDGDTYDFLIDNGMGKYSYETVRLNGVDAPEIFRPQTPEEKEKGFKAKEFVTNLLLNKPVLLDTYKDAQTFGRYVADVYVFGPKGDLQSVANLLSEANLLK